MMLLLGPSRRASGDRPVPLPRGLVPSAVGGFVARTLVAEGIDGHRAALAARLAGGTSVGRAGSPPARTACRFARRPATIEHASRGQAGALEAADLVLVAAERYRKDLGAQLEEELAPFLDERGRAGRPIAARSVGSRNGTSGRFGGRSGTTWTASARGLGAGARPGGRGRRGGGRGRDEPGSRAAARRRGGRRGAMAAVEEARAALAEDLNLNTRLVLEQAFLARPDLVARPAIPKCGAGITVASRTRWEHDSEDSGR